MQRTREEMEALLSDHQQYRDALFCRGYLLTEDDSLDEKAYPFYGTWKEWNIQSYRLLVHPKQDVTVFEEGEQAILLIGHAYDPFTMCLDEKELLSTAAKALSESREAFFDCINGWTGIFVLFVLNREPFAVQDCAGIKALYYGTVEGHRTFTSHPQLVADLYSLSMDPFVRKLVTNRFYNIGNRYLPGDLSPYAPLMRMGANVTLHWDGDGFSVRRFFPNAPHPEITTEEEYQRAIEESARILSNGIRLASEKWERPAISLSGGTDSKTTLACANGLYDRFLYYSFQSKESEVRDSLAAQKICADVGITHRICPIASENEQVEDFDVLKAILDHTTAYEKNLADNEVRKYIHFYRAELCDVEIKSWISEVVRVFFDRKYGIRMPKKLTPRHFSIFQTRYFLSPRLLHESDRLYRAFMERFGLTEAPYNYEHTDFYYWEVRMSNWGMQVASSQDMCHRVTFPFNNRKLMILMLSIPREKRIDDTMHQDIIKRTNHAISDANIHVKNNYFTSKRIWLEKIYYYYRTIPYRLFHR